MGVGVPYPVPDRSGAFYDTHMMECVTDVLTRMLEEERYMQQTKDCPG